MRPKYKNAFLDNWQKGENETLATEFLKRQNSTEKNIENLKKALAYKKRSKENLKSKHAAVNVKVMFGLEWCEFLCKHMIG